MAPKAQAAAPRKAGKSAPVAAPAASKGAASKGAADSGSVTPTIQRSEEGAAPMTPKNFRNHPDMENFFRFIYENDLRLEALDIIDQIIVERKARKRGKGSAQIAN